MKKFIINHLKQNLFKGFLTVLIVSLCSIIIISLYGCKKANSYSLDANLVNVFNQGLPGTFRHPIHDDPFVLRWDNESVIWNYNEIEDLAVPTSTGDITFDLKPVEFPDIYNSLLYEWNEVRTITTDTKIISFTPSTRYALLLLENLYTQDFGVSYYSQGYQYVYLNTDVYQSLIINLSYDQFGSGMFQDTIPVILSQHIYHLVGTEMVNVRFDAKIDSMVFTVVTKFYDYGS